MALGFPSAARGESPRVAATLLATYTGSDPGAYAAAFDQVRLWVRQAQLEVSSQLGLLRYQEGFRYRMTIRFADGAPPGVEHILAYVSLGQDKEGFLQELVINVLAASKDSMGLQTVFFHEMTHAVMNDAVGGDATQKIPRWLHEGLAQWIGGDGEKRLKELTSQYKRASFLHYGYDLDQPDTFLAYPEYYLGVKFILDKKGINSLQALVRNLISGMPFDRALEDSCSLKVPAFKAAVRDYSYNYFQDRALRDL